MVLCLSIPAAAFADAEDDCKNARGESAIEMACGKLMNSAANNPEDLFHAHATAGIAYRDSGLGDLAISEYGKAIAIDPNNATVRVLRGQAFNKPTHICANLSAIFPKRSRSIRISSWPMSVAAPLATL
jgi:tetratricopeptide (TPR) repeat protein